MSAVSITSHEANLEEAKQELDSLKALNNSLKFYLEQLRTYKRNLLTMNDNLNHVKKVNEDWIKISGLVKK